MKNLKVLKDKVLVEKLQKKPEKQPNSLFVEAEVSDSQGSIIALGEEYSGSLTIGDKVYYGRDTQAIRMTGKDVMVMAPENVVAVVEASDEKATQVD